MGTLTRYKYEVKREDVLCHLCERKGGKAVYSYLYNNQTSEIIKCVHCAHLYIYPVPLAELNDRSMDTIDDAEFFGIPFLKRIHEDLIIKKEIQSTRPLLKVKNPTLLDIGCGTGWTTAIWKKYGFDVTGLEPSKERGDYAKEQYGIKIINHHIENFSTEQKFDVVILRHLLEHLEQPSEMLKRIRGFLKDEGLLIIILPNINCIGRYIFQENWNWILPWHLHFYTPKTLCKLLEKNGYTIKKLYQTPSPLWYPSSLRKALHLKWQAPSIINLVLFSPLILLGMLLNLNDNLTVIAQNYPQNRTNQL